MTETGGNEDTPPAQSTPPAPPDNSNLQESKEFEPMETDQDEVVKEPCPAGADLNGNETSSEPSTPTTPTSKLPLVEKTPNSTNRVLDDNCFKTPESATPTTSAKKRKRLTPEERSLREKDRQDKRRKREEEFQKREEEKQRREQEKIEKAKQREEERIRKEEEKRRQEEEKRLERLKKEEEKKRSDEEKKRIEEEKRQDRLKKEEEKKRVEEEKRQERLKKEEEKKRKEDEKKQKVEEKERERLKLEGKKAKQAQLFSNFFQKGTITKLPTIDIGKINQNTGESSEEKEVAEGESLVEPSSAKTLTLFNPLPFQIKTDMGVAPLCRRGVLSVEEKENLDLILGQLRASNNSDSIEADSDKLTRSSNFLKSLKEGMARNSGRTEVRMAKDSDIQILDDSVDKRKDMPGYIKWRMKLLQFKENRRPAYWGTWKHKPKEVTARRPLAKEQEIDYEFDSDDEWEDEPEDGEEIGDSEREEEDQDEAADAEDDDEGWMVPHGYLSDSEREGAGTDLELIKKKEKEFYKSLKEKTMMGLPFIETESLSIYAMRVCPVFKSAPPMKPSRKRSKPKPPPIPAAEDNPEKPNKGMEPPPAPLVSVVPSNEEKWQPKRKSTRVRKIPKDNPYALPPTGFLAMDLPSDEDDMDWEVSEIVTTTPSGSSDSDSEEGGEEDKDDGDSESEDSSGSDGDEDNLSSSDSDEDLFIPVVSVKPKANN